MKKILITFLAVFFFNFSYAMEHKTSFINLDTSVQEFLKQNRVYDYSEEQLSELSFFPEEIDFINQFKLKPKPSYQDLDHFAIIMQIAYGYNLRYQYKNGKKSNHQNR